MTSFETSEAPPRKRTLLSIGWRFGATLPVAFIFGYINGNENWPTWAYYPPKLVVALAVGVLLGIAQEKPFSGSPQWRGLRWRMVGYQAISWACSYVLFLSGTTAWKYDRGWETYFFVVALLLICAFLSERLISRFRCPYCHQFFFDSKSFSKSEESGNFLIFGVSHWRNTRCQQCGWPLWKPADQD